MRPVKLSSPAIPNQREGYAPPVATIPGAEPPIDGLRLLGDPSAGPGARWAETTNPPPTNPVVRCAKTLLAVPKITNRDIVTNRLLRLEFDRRIIVIGR